MSFAVDDDDYRHKNILIYWELMLATFSLFFMYYETSRFERLIFKRLTYRNYLKNRNDGHWSCA